MRRRILETVMRLGSIRGGSSCGAILGPGIRRRRLACERLEERTLLSVARPGVDADPWAIDTTAPGPVELVDSPVGRATRDALEYAGGTHGLIELGVGEIFRLATGPAPSEIRIHTSDNVDAADTTNADQVKPGGLLGLNLTGSGYTVGVWDAGLIRDTHQEFGGRVTLADSGSFDYHATHVAGTIGASGVAPRAEGMATQVALRSRDWNNDISEMSSDAALIQVSNHSYSLVTGWHRYAASDFGFSTSTGSVDVWFDDRYLYSTEDPDFGKYTGLDRDIDQVLYENPGLLSVWSAGNNRSDAYRNYSGDDTYVAWFSGDPGGIGYSGAGWYLVPNSGATSAPPGDGNSGTGYDSLSGKHATKNTLIVGAVEDIINDPYSSGQVVMTSYSSWGPTDDGRIKPDLVGNGTGLYSAYSGSDAAYGTLSGTSMSSPNVAGTAVLLVEHFQNEFGSLPDSASTRGLLIHTATDAGNVGPDYAYGWGLVNAADAATFLTDAAREATGYSYFDERTYGGAEWIVDLVSDGTQPMKATLAWTDPAGTPPADGIDVPTPVLVNDLDLWITGPGGTYQPWTLDPANPAGAAVRTTANRVDNVEQVLIDAPSAGTYTLHVGHTGGTFSQDFSLLVSGAGEPGGVGVDLRGTHFDVDPDNLAAAVGRASTSFTIRNLGDTAAGAFDVKFYLSDDATIDPATDILLNLDPSDPNHDGSEPSAYHLAGLAAMGTHAATITLAVPGDDPLGTDNDYYLGMFVDADADVGESDETNNRNHGAGLDRDDVYYLMDFGDAPEAGTSYPTRLSSDGARHVASGPMLGTARDAEPDGQPTAAADGDDIHGALDEENGVTFTSALVGGQAATVTVVASAAGLLNAWIDLNSDGDWADAGERIFDDEPLVAGVNSKSFPVPATPPDVTYARFRVSTAGGLSFDGPAPDGEVEDYALGTISGSKWNDQDGDGSWDSGEAGLAGWTLYVDWNENGQYDPGEPFDVSDADGNYTITGLPPAAYTVAEVPQAGWEQTFPAAGAASALPAPPSVSPSTAPMSRSPSEDFGASVLAGGVGQDYLSGEGDSAQMQTATWIEPRPVSADSIAGGGGAAMQAATGQSHYVSVNSDPDGDMPREVVFTPDGASVLVVNRDTDNLVIFDADTRAVTATIPVGDGPVDVAVTPDGRYAVVPNLYDNTVTVVDLATRSVAAQIPVTGSQPYRVEVTADGAHAVVGVINDAVGSSFSVISLSSLAEVRSFASGPQGWVGVFVNFDLGISGNRFTQFAVSPDSTTIVFPDRLNDQVVLYDLTTGSVLAALATAEVPNAVDVSADGTLAVVNHYGTGGAITKIDLVSRTVSDAFPLADAFGHAVRITADMSHAIVEILNNVVFVDLATGEVTSTIYTGAIGDLEISYDGQYAFVSKYHAMVIDIASQTVVATLTSDASEQAAVSPVDYRAAALNNLYGEAVHFFNINGAASALEGRVLSGALPEGDAPTSLEFAGAGETLVVGNRISGNVSIVDLQTETVRGYIETGVEVAGLATTPDGAYAVAADAASHAVAILDLASETVVASLPAAEYPYYVVISPDGQTAYVGSVHGTDLVHFIHLAGAASSVTGTLATGQIGRMALNPDGSLLGIYDYYNGEFVLVDTAARTEIARVELTTGSFSDEVTFSPDGSTAYVANAAGGRVFVVAIDGAASHLVATIGGISGAATLDVDAAGEFVYVGGSYGDDPNPAVYVVQTATNSVVRTILLSPSWMYTQEAYFSPADSVLYVTAALSIHTISSTENSQRYDQELYRVSAEGASSWLIDSTRLTHRPYGLAFSEARKTAAVALPTPDGVDLVDFRAAPGAHAVILGPGERETGIDFGNRVPPPLDFGDADGPYPTTRDEDGARHAPVGPTLGANRDSEPDGTHSPHADADDTTGTPDDEDGVTLPVLAVLATAATTAAVDIDLQNADPAANYLDAWIDFNQDGDWDDPGERIFTSYNLGTANGVQSLAFTVPQDTGGNIVYGTTAARFRLSTAGGLLPTGPADDGEVEDYLVALTWFGPPAALNTNAGTDTGQDAQPQVTTDGTGNWVAVWQSTDSLGDTIGTDYDILVSRSADAGGTWTDPVFLNGNADSDSGSDQLPQVTTDGAGNWVAVWQSDDDLGGAIGTDLDILVSRSVDGGLTWTMPAPLNSNAETDSGDDWRPQVTTDGAGNWVAVWRSLDSLGGTIGTDWDILCSRSADAGETWTAPAALNSNAESDSDYDSDAQVTTDGAGNWVAVWTSTNDLGGTLGPDGDIFISRSDDVGETWTAPAALNSNANSDTGWDSYAQVTTDGAGNWIAVWASGDSLDGTIGPDADILWSRSTDSGATWSVPAALNRNAGSDSRDDSHPQVTTDGAGNWVAVWRSYDSLGGTVGPDLDILVSRSADAGGTWTAPAPLNTNAGSDDGSDQNPQVTTDGAGNWVAVWYSSDSLGGTIGDENDILFARFSAVLWDFGDAEAPYPTTLAENGARHTPTGPTLGANRDWESDGAHSAGADADDTTSTPDDEDGVTLSMLVVSATSATTASVEIDLQHADDVANYLDAWIDFNADGDWDDPGERIFTGYNLGTTDGTQTLSFTVPQDTGGNIVYGTTYARFRLSTTGGLLPTGPADDGEVEDHLVALRGEVEDFETGDFSKFPWVHSGDASWTITGNDPHAGGFSARSGAIADNQASRLAVTLETDTGYISFWRKVSSEVDRDHLLFYIDGNSRGSWSGDQAWGQFAYPIVAGEHTFTWIYRKDGGASGGSDAAWIDDVAFAPLTASDLDFGDADAPYPTTLAEDGARHTPSGPTLGAHRDWESDGTHSPGADADDTTGTPDDEDGVILPELTFSAAAPTIASLEVDLQHADPWANYLDAWIDFNADGDWDDPGERIFSSYNLGSIDGPQMLTFTVPRETGGNVVYGTTCARFRLSTIGGLLPTGAAADGEVEDYPVVLTWFGPPRALNTNADSDSGDDYTPQLTTDGAGNWVAVWNSWDRLGGTIGSDADILVSRSVDDGGSWSDPVPLNTNAATDSGNDEGPQVATDGIGNWVTVWFSRDSLGGSIGTDRDILVSRSSDAGVTWSDPAPLNTNAYTDSGVDNAPQIAADGAGNWVAVWCSYDDLGGTIGTDADILVSRSADGGATWTDPAWLSPGPDFGDEYRPQITTDGAGNWVAVWYSGFMDVLVSRSSDAGASWTAPAYLSPATNPRYHFYPQVTTDGAGTWLAVWHANDTPGTSNEILVSRSADAGATWTAPTQLSNDTGPDVGSDWMPQVTTDGADRWVVVWQSDDDLGGTIGTDLDVLASRSSDGGVTWSAPTPVNSNAESDSGGDSNPQLTTDGAGHWIAVWQSDDSLGWTIGTDQDILFATFSEILPKVVGRHVFYNNSKWDGHDALASGDPAANEFDDGAIATDKQALLPGQTGTFANYTSYPRGINGIMVDIQGPADPIAVADGDLSEFDFRYGNDDAPDAWPTAPAPVEVAVRDIGGGVHRVTFIWADKAIPNKNWVQVTVKQHPNTGLAADDVFYFGNTVGENTGDFRVDYSDAFDIIWPLLGTPLPIGPDHVADINRDGRIDYSDVFDDLWPNLSGPAPLKPIHPPALPVAPLQSTDLVLDEDLSWAIEMIWLDQLYGTSSGADDSEEDEPLEATAVDGVFSVYYEE